MLSKPSEFAFLLSQFQKLTIAQWYHLLTMLLRNSFGAILALSWHISLKHTLALEPYKKWILSCAAVLCCCLVPLCYDLSQEAIDWCCDAVLWSRRPSSSWPGGCRQTDLLLCCDLSDKALDLCSADVLWSWSGSCIQSADVLWSQPGGFKPATPMLYSVLNWLLC